MNRHAIVMIICATLACSACTVSSQQGKIYRGTYIQNFETSAFAPNGSKDMWCIDSFEMQKVIPYSEKSVFADVVIRGELSAKGKYCNLGAFDHVLKVYEVIKVSNVRSRY